MTRLSKLLKTANDSLLAILLAFKNKRRIACANKLNFTVKGEKTR